MEERLQKILAHAGIGSRRACEQLILDGCVLVNGKPVTDLGVKVDPKTATIKVNQKLVASSVQDETHQYVILHKPRGILTTMTPDPEGRPTILDLLNRKIQKHRLYPVGRLDFNSEGLLLLTNDGELAFRMTHPKFKLPKTYEVKVHGIPPKKILDILAKGVKLEDGRTQPARVKVLRATGNNAWLLMTIVEGKKRQIRRMCEKVRYPVSKLRRVKIGPLKLSELAPGSARFLTDREILLLKQAVELA